MVPVDSQLEASDSSDAGRSSRVGSARRVGRYELYDEIATGGMATVHLGKLRGDGGFHRIVAIKRLHPQYARDPMFVRMFRDEARLAGRVNHPNVVATLDVVAEDNELFSVMDYVPGETLAQLAQAVREDTLPTRVSVPDLESVESRPSQPDSVRTSLPIPVILTITHDVLEGLHAAHEATDEHGAPLGLVHRDVSPQNILVGTDGRARVLDFGVAKAAGGTQTTETGVIKGKLAYMSPEQVYGEKLDRRADIYALGVVLWELLAARRLFVGHDQKTAIGKVLNAPVVPPGVHRPEVPAEIDEIVMRALDRDVDGRYATASEMASDIAGVGERATTAEVRSWVQDNVGEKISVRARLVSQIESVTELTQAADSTPTLDSARDSRSKVQTVTELIPEGASFATPSSDKRRAGRILLYGMFAFVGVVVAWNFLSPKEPSPSPVPETVTTPEPAVEVAPAESTKEQAAAPASAVPSAAATQAPSVQSAVVLPKVPPHRLPGAIPPRRVPKRPASNCNPPYVLDAKGHKRYKRGCL